MSKLTELHTLDMWVLFYFFKPHLYIHEAAIKAHRVKDMKHRFPQPVLTVEAPGATESPHPCPPRRVSVMRQGSYASCKGARNSQALEMGNPHIK